MRGPTPIDDVRSTRLPRRLVVRAALAVAAAALLASGSWAADLLTPAQRAWLDAHAGKIRTCAIPDFAPIDFVDEEGRARGLTADVLAALEERLGFRVERVACSDWAEIVDKARRGDLDLVGSIQDTPERRRFLAFTQPYVHVPNAIVVRAGGGRLGLGDLAGKRVAIVRGYATAAWLRAREPSARVVEVPDNLAGLERVAFGQTDAMVTDLAVATHFIQKFGLTNLEVAGTVGYTWHLSFGVRRDWPELVAILDRGLAALPPGELDRLWRRWVGFEPEPFYRRPAFWGPALGLLGALAAIALWNRTLAVRVRRATDELRRELAERQRAEAGLERARATLATVFDAIDAYVYVADLHTHEVLFVNRSMAAAFGDDLVGRPCHRVFRGRDTPCPHCTNPRLVGPDGEPAEAVVWEGRNPRTGRWYLNRDRAIRWIDGQLVRLQTATDVTERRDTEVRLRRAERLAAVGALAGGIAHDFNNLLTPILGHAELALEEPPCAAGHRDAFHAIRRAADRARALVVRILALGRGGADEAGRVSLGPVVAEAAELLRASLPATLRVVTSVPETLPPVEGVASELHQVVMNLAVNARHAMGDGPGTLTLELAVETLPDPPPADLAPLGPGDHVRLTVADTGCGMDDATLGHIFDPYFSTRAEGEGTGLGLATVRAVVGRHRGAIRVASRPGEGTRFDVLLPAAEAVAPESPPAAAPARPRGTERVLVVDDEPPVREFLAAALEGLGYRVDAVDGAEEAARRVERDPAAYDLVLTDLTMPGMTGVELLARVRAARPDLPVLVATGYGEGIEGCGADGVLGKPVRVATLATEVRRALDRRG